jgi:hydrogenase maturation protease
VSRRRVLVAGIGNVFLGDDGFGVEVVRRLAHRKLPEGVAVRDFGIRGMDLAYVLQEDYELVVFVDATPRGGNPGTIYLIEPEIEDDGEVSLDTHGMDPVKVIKLSRWLGAPPIRTLLVGCEPQVIVDGEDYDDMVMELSEPVQEAVAEAVEMVESLVAKTGEKGDRREGRTMSADSEMDNQPGDVRPFDHSFESHVLDTESLRNFRNPAYFARGALSNPAWERIAERLSGIFSNIEVAVYEGRHHLDAPHVAEPDVAEPERFARALRKLWSRATEAYVPG